MRARAAYIRSLGTTGILLAAAILILGVVGALVGFHGWPEGAVGGTVTSVPLNPAPQPVLPQVREVRAVRAAPALTRAARVLGHRTVTAGLLKEVPVSAPRPVGSPVALAPGEVAPTSGPNQQATPAENRAAPGQPAAPTDPQELQTLVVQLVGSAPPPPSPPPAGAPTEVRVPIVGVTVTAPSVPSR